MQPSESGIHEKFEGLEIFPRDPVEPVVTDRISNMKVMYMGKNM
jgi:hypothetical protein